MRQHMQYSLVAVIMRHRFCMHPARTCHAGGGESPICSSARGAAATEAADATTPSATAHSEVSDGAMLLRYAWALEGCSAPSPTRHQTHPLVFAQSLTRPRLSLAPPTSAWVPRCPSRVCLSGEPRGAREVGGTTQSPAPRGRTKATHACTRVVVRPVSTEPRRNRPKPPIPIRMCEAPRPDRVGRKKPPCLK